MADAGAEDWLALCLEAPVVSVVTRGPLALRAATKECHWRGGRVCLTPGEFDIVLLLVGAARDVTLLEIYETIRPAGFITGSGPDGWKLNARTFVKRIRKKFHEVDPGWDAIETHSGVGYRWVDRGE